MASPAIKRLQQDLKQLQQQPLVGVNAQPANDKDMMVWNGIVVGTEGTPLAGIPFRFCMELPNDYPNSPPKAYFETYISYNSGAATSDSKGRIEVCLNIFGNFRAIHSEWSKEAAGWSPAYTVSTILLSMQAMMMEDMLSTDISSVQRITDSALKYTCHETGHIGSDSSKWFPQIVSNPAVAASIAEKYRKENPQANGVLETFFICYANGQLNGSNSTLGFGVHIENSRNGILSSPCEYLSKESFINAGIRNSTTNKPFEYWLPILVRNENWTTEKNIKKEFLSTVNKICAAITFTEPDHKKVFKVCSSLMNSLVVEIMKNKGNATANDKFINGYFSIFRLLHQYAQDDIKLIEFSNNSLKQFLTSWAARVKTKIPNLGEFLMHLTISTEFNWDQIANDFMSECDARNVFWYCVGNQSNLPAHPQLIDTSYKGQRVTKVFQATEVSRNLVMFQIKFAIVTKFLDLTEFNSNFGLAPDNLKAELKNLYGQVVAVRNWNEFYDFVQMPQVTAAQRERDLEEAVNRSARQGYHQKRSGDQSQVYNNNGGRKRR